MSDKYGLDDKINGLEDLSGKIDEWFHRPLGPSDKGYYDPPEPVVYNHTDIAAAQHRPPHSGERAEYWREPEYIDTHTGISPEPQYMTGDETRTRGGDIVLIIKCILIFGIIMGIIGALSEAGII